MRCHECGEWIHENESVKARTAEGDVDALICPACGLCHKGNTVLCLASGSRVYRRDGKIVTKKNLH
jgi:hypothetical protein